MFRCSRLAQPPYGLAARLDRLERRLEVRLVGNPTLQCRRRRGIQFAIGEAIEQLPVSVRYGYESFSAMMEARRARARDSRDITVPIGTLSIAAMSR